MLAQLAADAVLVVHFGFIVFALFGGLLVWRAPSLAWLHLPAVAWAIFIEATGRVCPLTYVENAWRRLAGQAGYAGDFVSHYLLRVVYPDGLTRGMQIALALVVVALNAIVYARWLVQKRAVRDPVTR